MMLTMKKATAGRKKDNPIKKGDVDDFMEEEMDSAFNNLGEEVSDPFRRRGRFGRRKFRRFRRTRRRRRRYCIRLPGACG